MDEGLEEIVDGDVVDGAVVDGGVVAGGTVAEANIEETSWDSVGEGGFTDTEHKLPDSSEPSGL